MTKIERRVTICNQLGLHARAATKLAILSAQFDAEVTLNQGDKQARADSVLGLLMLESSKGKTITMTAQGADASAALDAICELINDKFHEEN